MRLTLNNKIFTFQPIMVRYRPFIDCVVCVNNKSGFGVCDIAKKKTAKLQNNIQH